MGCSIYVNIYIYIIIYNWVVRWGLPAYQLKSTSRLEYDAWKLFFWNDCVGYVFCMNMWILLCFMNFGKNIMYVFYVYIYVYKYIICNQREREREIQCREVSSDWLQPLHSPTTFEEPWISMCTGVQHPKSMTMWQVFCLEGNIPRILQWKTRPFPYCCYDELIMRYVLFPNNNNIDIRLLMSYFTDYEYLR